MDQDELFQGIFRFLAKLHQLEDDLLAEFPERDLTEQQQNLMTVLYLSGPKNLSGLSRCLHINLPNCSREVKKLTQRGYVRKEGSCRDRRIIELSLTPLGQERVRAVMEGVKEAYFRRAGEWSPSRAERIRSALAVLEEELIPPEK